MVYIGTFSKSVFPALRIGFALLPWSALETSLKRSLGTLLRGVVPFDVYQGKGMEIGFKSVAMGLILQDDSRTLGEQDIEKAVAAALDGLAQECGASLRGM